MPFDFAIDFELHLHGQMIEQRSTSAGTFQKVVYSHLKVTISRWTIASILEADRPAQQAHSRRLIALTRHRLTQAGRSSRSTKKKAQQIRSTSFVRLVRSTRSLEFEAGNDAGRHFRIKVRRFTADRLYRLNCRQRRMIRCAAARRRCPVLESCSGRFEFGQMN